MHNEQVGAVTVVKPKGALNGEDTDQFERHLKETLAQSFGRLVIDVSAIPFVDSRALEVLLDATEQLAQSGRALKLCGVNELLREVLDLTELDAHFEYYEDATAAARSFL